MRGAEKRARSRPAGSPGLAFPASRRGALSVRARRLGADVCAHEGAGGGGPAEGVRKRRAARCGAAALQAQVASRRVEARPDAEACALPRQATWRRVTSTPAWSRSSCWSFPSWCGGNHCSAPSSTRRARHIAAASRPRKRAGCFKPSSGRGEAAKLACQGRNAAAEAPRLIMRLRCAPLPRHSTWTRSTAGPSTSACPSR